MKDIEYMMSLYPSGIKMIYGYVADACDRMEYRNSPMYDEYPDRLMMDRMCDTICDTIVSSQGPEVLKNMWSMEEESRAETEIQQLKKEMGRLGVIGRLPAVFMPPAQESCGCRRIPAQFLVPEQKKRPSWLRDMVMTLLIHEMYHRRCQHCQYFPDSGN